MRPGRQPLKGHARGRMGHQVTAKLPLWAVTRPWRVKGRSLDKVTAETRWPRRSSSVMSTPSSGAPL